MPSAFASFIYTACKIQSINILVLKTFFFLPKAASIICSQEETEYEKMQGGEKKSNEKVKLAITKNLRAE